MNINEASPAPVFARFTGSGRVHVLRERLRFLSDTLGRPLDDVSIGEWISGRQWALCGKLAPTAGGYGIETFDDDDLCRSCAGSWPHEPALLFEHPTPEITLEP